MILILSLTHDQTTSNVINWLLCENVKFTRINDGDVTDAEIKLSSNALTIHLLNGSTCELNSLSKYWYRRGHLRFTNRLLDGQSNTVFEINNHKNDNDIEKFIHSYLQTQIKSIGSYIDNSLNKLTELTVAKKIGILIPNTLISTSKKSALQFVTEFQYSVMKKNGILKLNATIIHIQQNGAKKKAIKHLRNVELYQTQNNLKSIEKKQMQ